MTAGHTFLETWRGAVCDCGVRWVDIANTRRDQIGQVGIAHVGALNDAEYAQIEAKRDHDWEALSDVSRGGR